MCMAKFIRIYTSVSSTVCEIGGMKEELLHYLWNNKTFLPQQLYLVTGEPLTILHPGLLNTNAGPDFFNARILIEQTTWAGNIEIHIKSSDWFKHRHHLDAAYNNVILHVVFEHDVETGLPTLALLPLINTTVLNRYTGLMNSKRKIPCEVMLKLPDEELVQLFLYRLAIERLERKCKLLEDVLHQHEGSWEKLFYITIAKYFGMQVNEQPFVRLAQHLPANLLAKHKNNITQTYALIFGVAGFLPSLSAHPEVKDLNYEFNFLQQKYNLYQLHPSEWKFAKTRPANFPGVRLAQFAMLVHQSAHLFSKLMQCNQISQAIKYFHTNDELIPWLDEVTEVKNPQHIQIGDTFASHLMLNAVIPIMFLFGKHQMNESLCERALLWLELLHAENNFITRFWTTKNLTPKHALHSQALLQLYNHYCKKQACLQCVIGNHILQHA